MANPILCIRMIIPSPINISFIFSFLNENVSFIFDIDCCIIPIEYKSNQFFDYSNILHVFSLFFVLQNDTNINKI